MNDETRIRILAERFLEGETSMEEERELLKLVTQDGLPKNLLPLRDLIVGLNAIKLPALQPRHKSPHLLRWLSAAAVVLLIAGAALWWHYDAQNEHVVIVYGERCTDREVVLKEMTDNLSMVTEAPMDNVDDLLNDMFDI